MSMSDFITDLYRSSWIPLLSIPKGTRIFIYSKKLDPLPKGTRIFIYLKKLDPQPVYSVRLPSAGQQNAIQMQMAFCWRASIYILSCQPRVTVMSFLFTSDQGLRIARSPVYLFYSQDRVNTLICFITISKYMPIISSEFGVMSYIIHIICGCAHVCLIACTDIYVHK